MGTPVHKLAADLAFNVFAALLFHRPLVRRSNHFVSPAAVLLPPARQIWTARRLRRPVVNISSAAGRKRGREEAQLLYKTLSSAITVSLSFDYVGSKMFLGNYGHFLFIFFLGWNYR